MKNKIVNTFVNTNELIESSYPEKQATNFGRNHNLKSSLESWKKYNPIWYIVERDPKYNYGLDFEIFAFYKADGINFVKEVGFGAGGTLTSAGLRRVWFEDGEIKFSEERYDKGLKYRPELRHLSELGYVFG